MSKNFEKASEYPLSWPQDFPRYRRPESSRFNTTLYKALENVYSSIKKFSKDSNKEVSDLIISSNYSLSNTKPKDSGVCIYFTWDGETTCIPVDRYSKVEDNLQAIHHCIEAERTKLRHGGINLVKAAFRGYSTLPPPKPKETNKSWRDVLDCHDTNTLSIVKLQYRKMRKKHHPDNGGNPVAFQIVQEAWEQAKIELNNS